MQKFAEVHFSAQKRLKFAKLLKNIEVSSKMLQNKPSKYIHLRTSLSACKITKKVAIFDDFLTLAGDDLQSAKHLFLFAIIVS